MTKTAQYVVTGGLAFACLLGVWTIFFGKGSTLTTQSSRTHQLVSHSEIRTHSAASLLDPAYQGIQGSQWSPGKRDEIQ